MDTTSAAANTFPCHTPVQMRFNDIDLFGHVNNSMYMQYLDLGKVQYFAQALQDDFNFKKESMVIVHIDLDFCSPTHYTDTLEVLTRCTKVGESSLHLEQRVVSAVTGQVKCSGRVVMVGFDIAKNEKMLIPDSWRRRIAEYEGK